MAENNKRLRQPTKEEYKNLPKTKAEAIKKGITRFNPGDEKGERVIRNYGSKAFPNGIIATAKNRNVTRGSENRRASTNEQTLTREDYRDYAKRNGHSQEKADRLYELNEKKLNALKARKGRTLKNSGLKINYEHGLPTTSKTYGGVEHWRNLLLMDEKSNTAKSDLMIKPQSAVQAGIPLSKQSALQMDFNDKPATPPKVKREIIKKDLTKNKPIKGFKKNKLWEQLRIKRANGNGNGNGNGKNGNGNGKNGKNGSLKIGAGSSNSFNGNLTKPSLADEAFKHLQLESFHKIRTPFGVMPRA